jgi:hypothetical protein
MEERVVVIPRSKSPVLAYVEGTENDGAVLVLRAEDGARFRFPADRVLATYPIVLVGEPIKTPRSERPTEDLFRSVRHFSPPFRDWLALRSTMEDGEQIEIRDVDTRQRVQAMCGPVAVALGLAEAAPWFRRRGTTLTAVPMKEALQELFHLHDGEFVAAGDAAVRDWWPRRADGVPDGWQDPAGDVGVRARIALERARFFEIDYEPDPDVAAAGALDALVDWALGGDVAGDARGKQLARSLGLPDDPDQLLEQLVDCGVLGGDVEPAPQRAGLAEGFSEEALAEAAEIVDQPISEGRADLTHVFTVAVDDADTREVDDALSIRRDGDVVELSVHISDVAASVPVGSALDAAVRDRASSLFLPDRSVLMFPPDVVLGRLSLSEDEERPSLTGVFRLDADGRVLDARFVRSLVRLTRRVTYEETRDPAALGPDAETGRLLVRVAEALRVQRERRGARLLRLPSQKVTVEDGVPKVALRLQDAPGDVAVSEAMVLHNTRAGELLADAGFAALYRGQSSEAPAGRRIPEPGDPLYASRIRRTFAPTHTSADPLEHAGLGAPAYAQCTSPMRRYADLVNQRQLAAAAHGEPPPYDRDTIAALAPALHDRERAVRHAADARTQYWVARAVESGRQRTLHGVLSKAPRRGLGSVWVPELCRELPLRAPRGWRAPREGTRADWRVAAVRPFRGRIELAPPEGDDSIA